MTLDPGIGFNIPQEATMAPQPGVRRGALLAAAVLAAQAGSAPAQSHGPTYGLATPLLGRGGWSLDVAAMGRVVGERRMAMLRPMISYGITEDVQASASLPMPLYVPAGLPPARSMARMPTNPDVEFMLGWRFHRRGTDVGTRFESTAFVAFDYPTDADRGGLRTSPGLVGAVVTGYASRATYLWAGALYRRYMSPRGADADHPGDVTMYSVVFGYRPPPFRKDYPHPDWRLFVETVGEYSGRDVAAGLERANSGGHQVFVAPTVLGLYGSWGISGGPALPVYRKVNGAQPRERLRFILNTTFWF